MYATQMLWGMMSRICEMRCEHVQQKTNEEEERASIADLGSLHVVLVLRATNLEHGTRTRRSPTSSALPNPPPSCARNTKQAAPGATALRSSHDRCSIIACSQYLQRQQISTFAELSGCRIPNAFVFISLDLAGVPAHHIWVSVPPAADGADVACRNVLCAHLTGQSRRLSHGFAHASHLP